MIIFLYAYYQYFKDYIKSISYVYMFQSLKNQPCPRPTIDSSTHYMEEYTNDQQISIYTLTIL